MELFGLILVAVGVVLGFTGGVGIILKAFRVSPGWGVMCILLPPSIFLFTIRHWRRARRPFLLYLGAILLLVMGYILMSVAPPR